MELTQTIINAAVVALVGLAVALAGKGRFDRLDQRLDRMEARLDARIDGLQSTVDGMRSDLTQVALAVGTRPRSRNA